ncbi:MAG TPA: alpha/beta fold hydrolase, partial [Acidimicrobiales bacterium]|nr:alpha/beta fold hydrolase [Acidimicrobiales bacterium]
MDGGTVEVNGVRYAYIEDGPDDGPLALCLHGFPDSAHTWRHLLPVLAGAGYRAVAPYLRGYAPTGLAPDGVYQTGALAADAAALHEKLGGGDDAVLIGHDWGALATYAAVGHEPTRWRRAVTAAVPPVPSVAGTFFTYAQLKRSWYTFFFQSPLAEMALPMDAYAFIDHLWADWSPGYDATWDI